MSRQHFYEVGGENKTSEVVTWERCGTQEKLTERQWVGYVYPGSKWTPRREADDARFQQMKGQKEVK